MKAIYLLTAIVLSSCYGVNSETSEIGSMNLSCLDSQAWKKIAQEYSIDSIQDPILLTKVDEVKNHFIKPEYILYFKDKPEEIIGCDWNSIRVVYNKKIANQILDGLDPLLGNDEQRRIRNRVLKEIMKYQCNEGQLETLTEMEKEVPYAESHKEYPLKQTPEMMEPEVIKNGSN